MVLRGRRIRVRRMSKKASAFIARKVRILRQEGYAKKQALAIAYNKARKHGFRIAKQRKTVRKR